MKPFSLLVAFGASALLAGCAARTETKVPTDHHDNQHTNLGPSALLQPTHPTEQPPEGRGYVTNRPHTGLTLADSLSPKARQENFDFLCQAIDETYADFTIKAVNWDRIRQRYQARLSTTVTADDFYRFLFELVNELKDTHSWLENYHLSLLASGPGLAVDLFEGKPFVVAVNPGSEAASLGVKAGSEILEVDGLPVENRMAQLRPLLHVCSTERAFRRRVCRHLLDGEKDSTVTLKLRSPEGSSQVLRLKRSFPPARPPLQFAQHALTRQRFVFFGQLPSGLGYIRIGSFLEPKEVVEEFDRALDAVRGAPGLILDIRDNEGGSGAGHPYMVGRFLQQRTLGATWYQKSGPGHNELKRHDLFLAPTGPWQYSGPVALLVNDLTGSAADLFACYLRSSKRVVTVGSTTHGNLSGVAAYAVMPCGLSVRISNGYFCDAAGNLIEGHGNEPDISVSPTITDLLTWKDPVLEKAVAVLSEKVAGRKASAEHATDQAQYALLTVVSDSKNRTILLDGMIQFSTLSQASQ